MSNQITEFNKLIQDRIDELMLLEQKASSRANSFLKENRSINYEMQRSVSGIVQSSKDLQEIVNKCAFYKPKVLMVILSIAIIAVLMFGGATWYINHAKNKVAELRQQEMKINEMINKFNAMNKDIIDTLKTDVARVSKFKPTIVKYLGKFYIRVAPDSTTGIVKDNRMLPGSYALIELPSN